LTRRIDGSTGRRTGWTSSELPDPELRRAPTKPRKVIDIEDP